MPPPAGTVVCFSIFGHAVTFDLLTPKPNQFIFVLKSTYHRCHKNTTDERTDTTDLEATLTLTFKVIVILQAV